jgi:uncharacterized membrane protein HdeD (DUF308 family)
VSPPGTTIAPDDTVGRVTRAFAVRGALLLVLGLIESSLTLLAFRIPLSSTAVLVVIMGTFLILDAITSFVGRGTAGRVIWSWLRVFIDAAAVILLLVLGPRSAIAVFTAWIVVSGLLDGAGAPVSGTARAGLALLAIALGLLVLSGLLRGPAGALLAISAYAIVAGGLQIFAARHQRSLRRPSPIG